MGIEIPEEYGGGGAKFLRQFWPSKNVARGRIRGRGCRCAEYALVNNALLRWGSAEQKKRYLPKMAADTVGAYALSEAGSGSDAFALQTRAELKGTDYI